MHTSACFKTDNKWKILKFARFKFKDFSRIFKYFQAPCLFSGTFKGLEVFIPNSRISQARYVNPGIHLNKKDTKLSTKSNAAQGQGKVRGCSRPKPRPDLFEAKAKARDFCPCGVLEVRDSLQGLYPILQPVKHSHMSENIQRYQYTKQSDSFTTRFLMAGALFNDCINR